MKKSSKVWKLAVVLLVGIAVVFFICTGFVWYIFSTPTLKTMDLKLNTKLPGYGPISGLVFFQENSIIWCRRGTTDWEGNPQEAGSLGFLDIASGEISILSEGEFRFIDLAAMNNSWITSTKEGRILVGKETLQLEDSLTLTNPITSIAVSPGQFYWGDSHGTLYVSSLEELSEHSTMKGRHQDEVSSISLSLDNVATSGWDRSIVISDDSTSNTLQFPFLVNWSCYVKGEDLLAVGYLQETEIYECRDLNNLRLISRLPGASECLWDPRSRRFFIAMNSGALLAVDPVTMETKTLLAKRRGLVLPTRISSFCLSQDGTRVAVGWQDGRLAIYELKPDENL